MNAIFDKAGKDKKKRTSDQPFSERSLFQVLKARDLLAHPERMRIIQEIEALVKAPDKYFKVLYRRLIDSVVEYLQIIPVKNNGRLAGLMDEALLRALYVLQLQKEEGGLDHLEPLYIYVLFSAALMFDVGRIAEDRNIIISDKRGNYLNNWLPFDEKMPTDSFYRLRRGGGTSPWLSRRITPLLAQRLMPSVGFNWIARDRIALNTWLALLNDEAGMAGGPGLIFSRALEKVESVFSLREAPLTAIDIDIIEAEETALGDDFIEWLEKGLDEGSITVNQKDSAIHVVKGGVLLETAKLAEDFIKEAKSTANVSQVIEKFEKTGYAEINGGDKAERQFFYSEDGGKPLFTDKTSYVGSTFLRQRQAQQEAGSGDLIEKMSSVRKGKFLAAWAYMMAKDLKYNPNLRPITPPMQVQESYPEVSENTNNNQQTVEILRNMADSFKPTTKS